MSRRRDRDLKLIQTFTDGLATTKEAMYWLVILEHERDRLEGLVDPAGRKRSREADALAVIAKKMRAAGKTNAQIAQVVKRDPRTVPRLLKRP